VIILSSDKPLLTRRIRARLLLAFLAVTSVPLVVTAVYATSTHVAAIARLTQDEATREVTFKAAELRDRLQRHQAQLKELSSSPLIFRLLDTTRGNSVSLQGTAGLVGIGSSADEVSPPTSNESIDFWRTKVERRLSTTAAMLPEIHEIVVMNESGKLLAGVERVGSRLLGMKDSRTDVHRFTVEQFGDSSNPVHLSQSGESLVWSEKLLSHATVSHGVLRMSVNADGLVESLGAGEWLLSSANPANPLSDGMPAVNEHSESPGPDSEFDFRKSEDGIVVWESAGIGDLRLGKLVSNDLLVSGVDSFRRTFAWVLLGGMSMAIALGVWLSRQLTEPVRGLLDGVRRVGQGKLDVVLKDDTGDELGALADGLNRTVAELRALHHDFERRLDEKAAELVHAERLATVGRTAASVAHEINNPSGIIALYAQLIKEQTPPDDPRIEKLNVIESKAREVSEIVRDLLDYARKPALQIEGFFIEEMVQEAVDSALTADDLPEDRQAISIELPATRLVGDRSQLRRVVRNLVVNGLHAMSPGDSMKITARTHDGDPPEFVLEVCDTGAGIEAEHLASIFEPFYTTKQYGSGTGLGLAISKEIVERHGGRIEIESVVGEGTTARIFLPQEGQE
jgi:signal transduction histidine kinase